MISKKSLELLQWIITVGDILKLLPYTCRGKDGLQFQTRNRNSYAYCTWSILGTVLVCIRLSWVVGNAFLIGFVWKDAERFVAIFYLSIELLTTPLHIAILKNPDQFAVPMNAVLNLNQIQGESIYFYGLKCNSK